MTDDLRRAISEKVLAARTHAQLTQEQLSAMIERSVEAVSNIERGLSMPTVDTIDRIARAVSVPVTFFFEDFSHGLEASPNAKIANALGLIVTRLTARDAGLLMTLAKSMKEAK